MTEQIVLIICVIIGTIIFFTAIYFRNKFCIILGAAVILGVFITILVKPEYTEYREALNALSSGAAVFIAATALYLNFQTRGDSLKKETRDRKERLLDNILQWTKDIDNACDKESMNMYFGLGERKHGALTNPSPINTLQRYEIDIVTSSDLSILHRYGLYLEEVSKGLKEIELEDKIKFIITLLEERISLIYYRRKPVILSLTEEVQQQKQAIECIDDDTIPLDNLSTYWKTSVLLFRNLKKLGPSIENINKEISTLKIKLLSER